MVTRNGNGYIVSVNLNEKMMAMLNSRKKGTRSAFLRRAIMNAGEYDRYVKVHDQMLEIRDRTVQALLEVLRYELAKKKAVLAGFELPAYDDWRWDFSNGDPKSRVSGHELWTDVYDVIEELTPHIDGLSNALHALEGTGGGQIESI